MLGESLLKTFDNLQMDEYDVILANSILGFAEP